MLLVDFFNLLFSTLRKTAVPSSIISCQIWEYFIGYREKPLIAVNVVGVINARCHFTEASQQKVEAAAHRRDVRNSNQQENVVEAPNCSHHSHANQLGYLYQLL